MNFPQTLIEPRICFNFLTAVGYLSFVIASISGLSWNDSVHLKSHGLGNLFWF